MKILSFVIAFSFCTASYFWFYENHTPKRNLSSTMSLEEILSVVEDEVNAPLPSSHECVQKMNQLYSALYNTDFESSAISDLNYDQAHSLIKKSFSLRIQIKEKLGQIDAQTDDDFNCVTAVRDNFRALRLMEDYLIEKITDENLAYKTLTGSSPYFLVNPKYQDEFKNFKDLKSGDVILSRGNAFSSAAIARIGKTDTQFSHLSFVYGDENGDLHTTEAHIEVGNVVAPIDVHINQGNARTVVFRYKDPSVAHEASKCAYDKVKVEQDKGKNIEYDFGMDYHDNSTLFCSEVIHDGFNCVTNNSVDVPQYKTKFHKGILPFLQSLGIQIDENNVDTFDTFGPGDIEYDANFEIIAEWRNPAKLRSIRMKDVILTKMFHLMEENDYRFHAPFKAKAASKGAWFIRRFTWVPFIKKLKELEKQFPLNMSAKQMELFIVVDLIGEQMYQRLEDAQDKVHHTLSYSEMMSILNKYAIEDMKKFKKSPKSSDWTKWYHPEVKKDHSNPNSYPHNFYKL